MSFTVAQAPNALALTSCGSTGTKSRLTPDRSDTPTGPVRR
jgi:hypothetical protein